MDCALRRDRGRALGRAKQAVTRLSVRAASLCGGYVRYHMALTPVLMTMAFTQNACEVRNPNRWAVTGG